MFTSFSEGSLLNFAPLYSLDAKKKIRIFKLKVEDDTLKWETGLLDGKLTPHSSRAVAKNVGRKNETTPQQQAISEAQSKWKKMIEREGYTQTLPLPESKSEKGLIPPMLLQPFEENKVRFEIQDSYVQPKIDGIRCLGMLIDDEVVLYSRNRSIHKFMNHIKEEVLPILVKHPNIVIDGELYRHKPEEEGKILKDHKGFNWITSHASFGRKTPGKEEKLVQYHIYDLICNYPFSQRYELIKEIIKESETLRIVETHKINDLEDVFRYHDLFVKEGYEGLVLRDKNLKYESDKRSHFILKVKNFETDEAIVTGKNLKDGSLDVSTFTWECRFQEGTKKFWVTPFGSKEERKEQYETWDKVNSLLTFKYQGEIDKKFDVPRFAIGISFRDYE
jgi:DNA ligase 1